MHHYIRRTGQIGGGIVALLLLVFVWMSLWPLPANSVQSTSLGVTFSRTYAAEDLGLDANAVLTDALDDLGVRRFRLPVYWKQVESQPGQWNFSDLDHDIEEIRQRQGSVILALGQKTPRWPECWIPSWVRTLSVDDRKEAVLNYIQQTVDHFKENSAVIGWQVENEAGLLFGECPRPDFAFVRTEMALIRQLDPNRPISTTESGEISSWMTFRQNVDAIGVSAYRIIRNQYFGLTRYWFLTPQFFYRKAAAVRYLGAKSFYISELQMEPWATQPLRQEPLSDQLEAFSLQQMKDNFAFAQATRLSPIDLWGVEWWYWMKTTQGHPEYWDEAREIFGFFDIIKKNSAVLSSDILQNNINLKEGNHFPIGNRISDTSLKNLKYPSGVFAQNIKGNSFSLVLFVWILKQLT